MPTDNREFDAIVRKLDAEFTRNLKGEKPTPEQIREYWERVTRARNRLVEKQTKEAVDREVMEVFKSHGIPIKELGNHQFWLMPSSTQQISFTWLEELNQRLPEGKKLRAIKPHHKGIAILIA